MFAPSAKRASVACGRFQAGSGSLVIAYHEPSICAGTRGQRARRAVLRGAANQRCLMRTPERLAIPMLVGGETLMQAAISPGSRSSHQVSAGRAPSPRCVKHRLLPPVPRSPMPGSQLRPTTPLEPSLQRFPLPPAPKRGFLSPGTRTHAHRQAPRAAAEPRVHARSRPSSAPSPNKGPGGMPGPSSSPSWRAS